MDKTILSGIYYTYFDKEKDRDIINNIMKIYSEKRYVNFDVPGLLKDNIYHNMDSIIVDTYEDILPYYKDIENKDNQLLQFLCECNSNTAGSNNFTFGFAEDGVGNVVGIVSYEFNSSITKIPQYVADNEKEISLYYKALVENIAYFIFKDICGSDDIVMFSDYSITEDNKESLIVYEDFPFVIHIDFENFPGREVTFYNIDKNALKFISNHYDGDGYNKIRVVQESKLRFYCNFVEEFKFIDWSVIEDLVL